MEVAQEAAAERQGDEGDQDDGADGGDLLPLP
jgi:hypothetical protein